MFEAETRAEILKRLVSYFDDSKGTDVSAVEGTFSFDTLSANAKEFEKAYAEMDLMMDAFFPQTSWGKYLDYLADELAGMSRRAATQAKVTLTLSGTAGAIVVKGTIFCTQDNTNFITDSTVIIGDDGTVEAAATAQDSGSGGNVAAGTITKIPVTVYGVSSVTNAAAAHDGYEEETDDALRDRLLLAIRYPATSGNVYHYINWAEAVSGVGSVKIIPLWNGNGTVKIIVVDSNKDVPSDTLLQNVKSYIDENAPIGATVTVAAPTIQKIDIALKVTQGTGDTDAISKVVTDYFKDTVFTNNYDEGTYTSSVTLSYAQIGRIILDNSSSTGVKDYESLTIGGGTSNITIAVDIMPVVGTVTLT